MTYKNAKIIFVAVLAIGLLGSFIVLAPSAIAEPKVGKNIIAIDFPTFTSPEIKRVTEIAEKLRQNEITTNDQKALSSEYQKIIQEHKDNVSSASYQNVLDKKIQVTKNFLVNSATFGTENSGLINSVYVDDATQELVIGIDAMAFSQRTAELALKQVRNVVGSDVDVKIQPMRAAHFADCSQTDNCEPAQAGVKIAFLNNPGCSIGFKATYNGNDGFVTAGHCHSTSIGGISDGTVGQPNYYWWDHIGDIRANTLYPGTDFDGMFVETDETISDKIYNNIDINNAEYASYLDAVIAEGYVTQGVSGIIVISSIDITVDGILLEDHAIMTNNVEHGDSGGPVYEYGASTGFVGIISASDFSTYTIISKQQNADNDMPGLTWNFN